MVNQGNGVIINTSPIVGLNGNVGQVNYAATKAGGMTKTLAKELGRKGVRVNAVAPGFTITPMTSKVPDKILEMMTEKIPLHRLAEPLDIAYAYGVNKPLENSIKFEVLLLPILFLTN